ncbi:PaMKK3 MAPK kinase encoded by the PaMKK3 protein [Diplogelasinospora grovesii]|uniref:mitogen-activated protein kinase kinase n=1 Tax=Diplogelasinospora grovesii TaxID=303347 RepID=A0AAN6NA90_9PEZI|nr:PaMKK3 MAPK kinase encoded by the PaMKK3 protein [Diplogelasinospora grovesii]
MADHDPDSVPATPDEYPESNPASPDSADESSEASTPLDPPSSGSDALPGFSASSASDLPRRIPSLRTVSDPPSSSHMSPSSSVSGTLNNARRPPAAANSLPLDIMQKARALQQQRMGMPARPSFSPQSSGLGGSPMGPTSPVGAMGAPGANMNIGGALAGGVPAGMRPPPGISRPLPPGFARSAPVVPSAVGRKPPSLSERRAMKLGGFPGSGSPTPGGTPKLSDMGGGGEEQGPLLNGEGRGSKLSDFKNYIDAEKGWITFDGAATITRTGVNFANGSTFSISLDEIEVLDELGKGNYGTVYKVRHARPKLPRFGQGLRSFKSSLSRQSSSLSEKDESPSDSPSSPVGNASGSNTTGVVMAMKEIRLELDEAKFATILKELVILHECVSPYIIDFYGAFYQEGAVYMCIEYMDGGSIDKLYAGGIPEPVLRKITYSTIMGLKTLKDDHNIIHRDVKPTNILVSTTGQVKICDFGVSGNLVASIAKTNIGCQSYMAPERISGGNMMAPGGGASGTYSVQSDIWSLGLTVIECAMGRYPYPPEVSSTIFSQLNAIVEGDPPSLPSEGYSATAQDFVRSCLNKIPTKRHTYPMLLAHPWLKPLGHPETITEDAEAEEAAADDELADATGSLNIDGISGDREVAQWVNEVLDRKRKGLLQTSAEKPALHAAPLDSVSPVQSPITHADLSGEPEGR